MQAIRKEVGAVFVPVGDIVRSARWYETLFDLPGGAASHEGRIHDVPLSGGMRLILDAHKPVVNSSQPLCYFHSDDIFAAEVELQRKGVQTIGAIQDIGSVWMLTFVDPDGNLMMLCQHKQGGA